MLGPLSERAPSRRRRRAQGIGTAHPKAVVGGRGQVPKQAGKRWHRNHNSKGLPFSWGVCHLYSTGMQQS